MLNNNVIKIKNIIKDLVNNKTLKQNIISIYAMGSFVEGTRKQNSDVDLNFFLNNTNYKYLKLLKNQILYIKNKYGIKIDSNIISKKEIAKDVLKSQVFTHRCRHALLIYELKHYNCLLYGKDILKNISFEYSELFKETVKLLLTLGYRLRKIYLSTGSLNEAKKQSVKFVVYACKFALINKGVFLYNNKDVEENFLKYFPYLNKSHQNIFECFKIKPKGYLPINNKLFKQNIDFIEKISKDRIQGYILIKKNRNLYFKITNKNLRKNIKDFLKNSNLKKQYRIRWVKNSSHIPKKYRSSIYITDDQFLKTKENFPILFFIKKPPQRHISKFEYYIKKAEDLNIIFDKF